MLIKSAEEFVAIWKEWESSPHFPDIEIESDRVWLEILEKYPEYDYFVVQYFVSPAVMAKLAYSPDAKVRYRVAMARRILPETFDLLSRDKDSTIRHSIATNPKCPKEILLKLSVDRDELVSDSAREKLERLSE